MRLQWLARLNKLNSRRKIRKLPQQDYQYNGCICCNKDLASDRENSNEIIQKSAAKNSFKISTALFNKIKLFF